MLFFIMFVFLLKINKVELIHATKTGITKIRINL